MTPAARIAAAIGILDRALAGEAAERTLTNWARANRYAGSGDRQAIRDLVFDALRCRRSFGWLGGGDTGRALMIGMLRWQGADPAGIFDGSGYAPPPLTEPEITVRDLALATRGERLDCPDWLLPHFDGALGPDADATLTALQSRAPVFLRVNLARLTREDALARLSGDGITGRPHALSPSAVEVISGARRVAGSECYRDGLVELQDAASQAVADSVPIRSGARVLDYCAGGGGKVLAMAARAGAARLLADFTAHDVDPARMQDIPARADRAGVAIRVSNRLQGLGKFDAVLVDAPCSGSGSWRRAPQEKWRLTPDRLAQLVTLQGEILDRAAALVAPGGVLTYATCSLFDAENGAQVMGFLARHGGWQQVWCRNFTPAHGGDGFFAAHLTRT